MSAISERLLVEVLSNQKLTAARSDESRLQTGCCRSGLPLRTSASADTWPCT